MLTDPLTRPGVEPRTEQAMGAWTDEAPPRSPSVIADAASVIAITSGCDPDEAFEALSRQAHLQQITMRDLATAVVYERRRGRDSHHAA